MGGIVLAQQLIRGSNPPIDTYVLIYILHTSYLQTCRSAYPPTYLPREMQLRQHHCPAKILPWTFTTWYEYLGQLFQTTILSHRPYIHIPIHLLLKAPGRRALKAPVISTPFGYPHTRHHPFIYPSVRLILNQDACVISKETVRAHDEPNHDFKIPDDTFNQQSHRV